MCNGVQVIDPSDSYATGMHVTVRNGMYVTVQVIDPSDSFLISVKCFEVCKTDQFAAGWTPRFPRGVGPPGLSPFRFDDKR